MFEVKASLTKKILRFSCKIFKQCIWKSLLWWTHWATHEQKLWWYSHGTKHVAFVSSTALMLAWLHDENCSAQERREEWAQTQSYTHPTFKIPQEFDFQHQFLRWGRGLIDGGGGGLFQCHGLFPFFIKFRSFPFVAKLSLKHQRIRSDNILCTRFTAWGVTGGRRARGTFITLSVERKLTKIGVIQDGR